jgi:hypothetical protein
MSKGKFSEASDVRLPCIHIRDPFVIHFSNVLPSANHNAVPPR